MCKLVKTTAVLLAIALAMPVLGATKPQTIRGAFCVPLAPGVPNITVSRMNGTGQSIYDFTIWIVGPSGARIGEVKVTSGQSGGADDWDVDDDGDGHSQEPGEKDDVDSTPGTSTRVDSGGDGKNNGGAHEPSPQSSSGHAIKKGASFHIKVTFNPPPTTGASICFAPTDKNAGQIDSGQLSRYALYDGPNEYAYDSTHPFPNITSSLINQTGGIVTALQFQTTGDYNLMIVEQIDPEGQTIAMSDCGGPECFLPLAFPVMPGGDVSLSAMFDHYSSDDVTILQIIPIVDFAVPVGACCLPDGDCLEQTFVDECFNRGGFYVGDDMSCEFAPCEPMPTGACFIEEDGICYEDFNEFDCMIADGTYLGDGSVCDVQPGDVDGDGDVDLADLATLLASYGTCDGDANYNAAADFDFDGCITLNDLATLLANYGS